MRGRGVGFPEAGSKRANSSLLADFANSIFVLSNTITYEQCGDLRSALIAWLVALLIDYDLDAINSTDAGPIDPVIAEILYNASTAISTVPYPDEIVRDLLTNHEELVTQCSGLEILDSISALLTEYG